MDEDGDTPDWIELYNYGSEEISLNNWSLTDIFDDNNPWTFPDITIEQTNIFLYGHQIRTGQVLLMLEH